MIESPTLYPIGLGLELEETFNSIYDFVQGNKDREKWFEKHYESTIDDWDNQESDSTIIEAYLEEQEGKRILIYIDDGNCGYFQIYKVKDQ